MGLDHLNKEPLQDDSHTSPLIYLVDDEANIRRLAAVALNEAGMKVETYGNGTDFLQAVHSHKPDLVIVDWMMPPPDGIALCRRLRDSAETQTLPIIMLTARTDEIDRVLGLELGADDYITKPFGVRELPARVRAILRRQRFAEPEVSDVLTRGRLTIDAKRRKLTKDSETIELTMREFDLLYLLMQHPGQVFSRDTLLDRVWQTNYYGDTRTVDVHIRYLRQKIEDEPNSPKLILTVRGIGYCFTENPDGEDEEN